MSSLLADLYKLTSRIHIEHRPAVEATMVRGRNIETGNLDTVRITPEGVGSGDEVWQGVYNPSFDVTPAELISEFSLLMIGGDADFRLCGY
jgi:methylthioribose-1-phosphate isomerase